MRALRMQKDGVALVDLPDPEAGGEALVRVRLSGLCATDLEIAQGYAGFDGTLGHEFVGIVEDAGGGRLGRGERVVGEINAGCGTCMLCEGGDARHCPARTVLGIVRRDGAHAEWVRLPARNLLRVPDSVPDEHAVFTEPLAAACGVLERCPMHAATRVAVVGDGKLGLLSAMVLRAHGTAPVLLGKHPSKRSIAERRGIQTAGLEDAAGMDRAFDVVIEASGAASGFALALALLRPQGTLVLKSTFHGATPVDAARIVVDEIQVIGSRCGRFAPALALLERGAVDVGALVSEVMPLDRGLQAMDRAGQPGIMKVLLRPIN